MIASVAAVVGLCLFVAALVWLRRCDHRADARIRVELINDAGPPDECFDPAMIEALPEPARRYFSYMICPGARLRTAVEIEMDGQLGLGDRTAPRYRDMSAVQLLAPPFGLVWKLRAGFISGSDGVRQSQSWTRFWLFGLVPLVRTGGGHDHLRSAFGRVVAEAAIWAPASLLPGKGVTWTALDWHSARATLELAGMTQSVDITVAADGQPLRVVVQRWSDVNPGKEFREQPFGGDLAGFVDVGGFRLPTVVAGGNHFGTDAYFPFYKVRVLAFRFPVAGAKE